MAESPVWDDRTKALYFVDIRGKSFYRMDYLNGKSEKTDVPQLLGCLALCENGDLLLSMEDGVYRRSDKDGTLTPAHQPMKIKGERFNDGKVGPDGCYYVGTAGANFSGAFYRMQNNVLEELFDGCGCSNGLDWTPDGATMVYCDSRKQMLERFSFSEKYHSLTGRESICNLDLTLGSGDGLCMDAEGMAWLAVWGGSCVLRMNPVTGAVLNRIDLPVTQVSSCCFAGDDLKDLIITTASVRVSLSEQPMAGMVFRYRAEVPGMNFYRYQ